MDNSIDLLILLFEEEKMKLQSRINHYLKESDYLYAHYHSKALIQLNHKLLTLHNIADKNYDDKEFKKRAIYFLEKDIHAEENVRMKKYYQEELRQAKRELERLNQLSTSNTQFIDVGVMDEVLGKLLTNKIKGLRLILNKRENLILRFSYSKMGLKVVLPNVKILLKNYTIGIYQVESFQNLGFELSSNESKLTLIFKNDKKEILAKLKIILSKIVFEIFHYTQFQNETFIEFTEKQDRGRSKSDGG